MVDLLAALNTGHRGGAGTIHANRIGDVVARFEALGLIGGLGRAGLHAQLVSAVQVVLVVERADVRRLAQIGLLCGNPPEVVEVWTARDGPGPGWETLQKLLVGGGQSVE